MIRLVVCDIDCTLIDKDEVLPKEALEMKRKLEEKGVYFSLATGRTESMAQNYVDTLDLSIPYVATNGATVVLKDKVVRRLQVPVLPLRPFIEKADSLGMTIVFSINGKEWYWRDTTYLQAQRAQFGRYNDQHIFTEEEWNTLNIDKLSLFTDVYDDRVSILEKDAKLLPEVYGYTRYVDRSIEIVHRDATKASGVEVLAESLGIEMKDVLFCGDHQNDMELIQAAGIGVAVANSTDDVKAVADYICRNRCFLGVKEAVDKFVFGVAV